MPTYDATLFDPPAPLAQVSLRNPESGAIISDVPLLLDTGADVTLLPRDSPEKVGVRSLPDQECELVGFDGVRASRPSYFLTWFFLNRVFEAGISWSDGECGVLGRDILNHVILRARRSSRRWSEELA